MREKTDLGIFIPLLQCGTMNDTLTRRNMALFASDVLPHLQKS